MTAKHPLASNLADQLHLIAAQLRAGTLNLHHVPNELSVALSSVLDQVAPQSGDWIEGSEDPPSPGSLIGRLADQLRADQQNNALAFGSNRMNLIDLTDPSAAVSAAALLELRGNSTDTQEGEIEPGEPPEIICSDTRPPPMPLHPFQASRYDPRALIGTGGQGDVREAYDRVLRRNVALKVLRTESKESARHVRAFLAEASLTGQLAHPCIVPIYEVGSLRDGSPAYTMKRIRGRSLKDILLAIRNNDPSSAPFTRRRLLEILLQVAHATGYAHDRGVIHRDLKPANVMIGDYGEVLVVDWGIAQITGKARADCPDGPVQLPPDVDHTSRGVIKGTPAYMAPEQAKGDRARLGPATDTHALGLILYEILLNEPARAAAPAEVVLKQARDPVRTSPAARRRQEALPVDPVPPELDQLCMKALAEDVKVRFATGEEFAQSLLAYLDGQKRREVAEQRAKDADTKVEQAKELAQRIAQTKDEVKTAALQTEPWAPLEKKQALWQLEDRQNDLEREYDELIFQCSAAYAQSLDDDPTNRRARRGQVALIYDKLLRAEELGRQREVSQLERQLDRLDSAGAYHPKEANGSLQLTTEPAAAEVWLHRIELANRILVPMQKQRLGRTPLEVESLPTGRYLVSIRSRGGHETFYPLMITRNSRWASHIVLRPDLDPSYVHVPSGPYIFGGDRVEHSSNLREVRWLDDFAIGRRPITCRQYLQFLASLAPKEAQTHVPRAPKVYGGTLWWKVQDGQIIIPRLDESGGRWDPRYPVRCISRKDAEAYASWRGVLDGQPLRLPTESEWEKAGRGVDGRIFPWGDTFDATFCKMRDSRPGRPDPEASGIFTVDRSPYGVEDLAGNISEWCSDPFDSFRILGTIKGGYWRGNAISCRLPRRFAEDPQEPGVFTGFRLAMDLGSVESAQVEPEQ